MKKHSKVGGRKGLPAYRTPSQFKSKVFEVVKKIPKGKVLTYKEVAQMSGSPRAYRAVGNILNKNFDLQIPCHRVIRSDNKIGGYNKGIKAKKTLLKNEGINIK